MRATETAWAAGFFDGEGTVGYVRGQYVRRDGLVRPTRGLVLCISQNDPEVLERFQRAVGGLGRVRPPRPGAKTHCYEYRINGAAVRRVVATLWPYLGSVKRSQATTAYERYEAAGAQMRLIPPLRRPPLVPKTHCVRGHPFDEANIYVTSTTGHRRCRRCKLDYMARWWRSVHAG